MLHKKLILSALFASSMLSASLPAIAAPQQDTAPAEGRRAPQQQGQPNFLVILADDLGWSDLGAFGGEIRTPNLDKLALGGVRFTGLHTAPTCSPTRSMLMSGTDNHVAGVGTMAESLRRSPALVGRPGYEGELNDRVASVAELLSQGGYRTIMSGKWHLGLTEDRSPAARGFERSFSLAQGLSNFWGEDQVEAWGAAGGNPIYREDRKQVTYPTGTYTTDYFTDRLIGFLDEGQSDTRPFFAYLAYTAPHWPIMAPEANVSRYKGRYDQGYEALRTERLAKQKALGLIPANTQAHDFVGVKPWESLAADEKAYEARKMEVYAGMVDRLDENVGRVIEKLKQQGRYDNTVIIFLSDNGPEGNDITSPSAFVNDPAALERLGIDNSYANIGKPNSYLGYGPGWAQANSSPSQLVKGYPTEGGTRVTAFAAGKGVAGSGRIARGNLSVQDITPTLLDLAGIQHPSTYNGKAIAPLRGHSLQPILLAEKEEVRAPDEPLGTELFFRRALRLGDWKAVFLPKTGDLYPRNGVGDSKWKLYNLANDPAERTDLSAENPEKLAELVGHWQRYAQETGVYVPDESAPKVQASEKNTAPAAR